MKQQQRLELIHRRQRELADWARRSKSVIDSFRESQFASFVSIDQLPVLDLRTTYRLRKISVEIPDEFRTPELKNEFCLLVLKLFVQQLDHFYGGEYLLGRQHMSVPSLFVIRGISNGDVAVTQLSAEIEGNLVILQIDYIGYHERVGQVPAVQALGEISSQQGFAVDGWFFGYACQQEPWERVAFFDFTSMLFGLCWFGSLLVGPLIALGIVGQLGAFLGLLGAVATAAFVWFVMGNVLERILIFLFKQPAADRLAGETLSSMSKILSPCLWVHDDHLSDDDHQLFIDRVLNALDHVTTMLDEMGRSGELSAALDIDERRAVGVPRKA